MRSIVWIFFFKFINIELAWLVSDLSHVLHTLYKNAYKSEIKRKHILSEVLFSIHASLWYIFYFSRNEKCLYCVSHFFEIAQWTIEKKFANVWIANVIVFSFSFCKKSASHHLPALQPGGSSKGFRWWYKWLRFV